MISILIPCFDYNAYPLVSILEKQALMLKIDFDAVKANYPELIQI